MGRGSVGVVIKEGITMVKLLGIRGVNKTLVGLFTLLFLFLALMAGVFIHMADQRSEQTALLSLAADQQLLS